MRLPHWTTILSLILLISVVYGDSSTASVLFGSICFALIFASDLTGKKLVIGINQFGFSFKLEDRK